MLALMLVTAPVSVCLADDLYWIDENGVMHGYGTRDYGLHSGYHAGVHGGFHDGWHSGAHWSTREGWHAGNHVGPHSGTHLGDHDRFHLGDDATLSTRVWAGGDGRLIVTEPAARVYWPAF